MQVPVPVPRAVPREVVMDRHIPVPHPVPVMQQPIMPAPVMTAPMMTAPVMLFEIHIALKLSEIDSHGSKGLA